VSSDDKVFHAAGPDVENARGPSVDVGVFGTTSVLSFADQSRGRPKMAEVGTQSCVRYEQPLSEQTATTPADLQGSQQTVRYSSRVCYALAPGPRHVSVRCK